MKLNDIFEGIPMGAKALATKPKNKYTFGFELEMHVDPTEIVIDTNNINELMAILDQGEIIIDLLSIYEIPDTAREAVEYIVYKYNLKFNKNRVNPETLIDEAVSSNKRKYANNLVDVYYKLHPAIDTDMVEKYKADISDTPDSKLQNTVTELRKLIYQTIKSYDLDTEFAYEDNGKIRSIFKRELYRRQVVARIITENFNFDEYILKKYKEDPKRFMRKYIDPFKFAETKFENVMVVDRVIKDGQVDAGVEVISWVYPDINGIKDLEDALKLMQNDPAFYTSSQTGLHINIGTFGYHDIDIMKFFAIMGASGALSLEPFNRVGNRYAQQMKDKVDTNIHNLQDIKDYDKYVEKMNTYILNVANKYDYVNFSKLLQYGYIEFRAMGGEGYETKIDEIKRQISRIIRAIEIARDPNAYRQEYFKMLIRFFPYNFNKPEYIKGFEELFAIGRRKIYAGVLEYYETFTDEFTSLVICRIDPEESELLENTITFDMIRHVKSLTSSTTFFNDDLDFIVQNYVTPKTPKLKKFVLALKR